MPLRPSENELKRALETEQKKRRIARLLAVREAEKAWAKKTRQNYKAATKAVEGQIMSALKSEFQCQKEHAIQKCLDELEEAKSKRGEALRAAEEARQAELEEARRQEAYLEEVVMRQEERSAAALAKEVEARRQGQEKLERRRMQRDAAKEQGRIQRERLKRQHEARMARAPETLRDSGPTGRQPSVQPTTATEESAQPGWHGHGTWRTTYTHDVEHHAPAPGECPSESAWQKADGRDGEGADTERKRQQLAKDRETARRRGREAAQRLRAKKQREERVQDLEQMECDEARRRYEEAVQAQRENADAVATEPPAQPPGPSEFFQKLRSGAAQIQARQARAAAGEAPSPAVKTQEWRRDPTPATETPTPPPPRPPQEWHRDDLSAGPRSPADGVREWRREEPSPSPAPLPSPCPEPKPVKAPPQRRQHLPPRRPKKRRAIRVAVPSLPTTASEGSVDESGPQSTECARSALPSKIVPTPQDQGGDGTPLPRATPVRAPATLEVRRRSAPDTVEVRRRRAATPGPTSRDDAVAERTAQSPDVLAVPKAWFGNLLQHVSQAERDSNSFEKQGSSDELLVKRGWFERLLRELNDQSVGGMGIRQHNITADSAKARVGPTTPPSLPGTMSDVSTTKPPAAPARTPATVSSSAGPRVPGPSTGRTNRSTPLSNISFTTPSSIGSSVDMRNIKKAASHVARMLNANGSPAAAVSGTPSFPQMASLPTPSTGKKTPDPTPSAYSDPGSRPLTSNPSKDSLSSLARRTLDSPPQEMSEADGHKQELQLLLEHASRLLKTMNTLNSTASPPPRPSPPARGEAQPAGELSTVIERAEEPATQSVGGSSGGLLSPRKLRLSRSRRDNELQNAPSEGEALERGLQESLARLRAARERMQEQEATETESVCTDVSTWTLNSEINEILGNPNKLSAHAVTELRKSISGALKTIPAAAKGNPAGKWKEMLKGLRQELEQCDGAAVDNADVQSVASNFTLDSELRSFKEFGDQFDNDLNDLVAKNNQLEDKYAAVLDPAARKCDGRGDTQPASRHVPPSPYNVAQAYPVKPMRFSLGEVRGPSALAQGEGSMKLSELGNGDLAKLVAAGGAGHGTEHAADYGSGSQSGGDAGSSANSTTLPLDQSSRAGLRPDALGLSLGDSAGLGGSGRYTPNQKSASDIATIPTPSVVRQAIRDLKTRRKPEPQTGSEEAVIFDERCGPRRESPAPRPNPNTPAYSSHCPGPRPTPYDGTPYDGGGKPPLAPHQRSFLVQAGKHGPVHSVTPQEVRGRLRHTPQQMGSMRTSAGGMGSMPQYTPQTHVTTLPSPNPNEPRLPSRPTHAPRARASLTETPNHSGRDLDLLNSPGLTQVPPIPEIGQIRSSAVPSFAHYANQHFAQYHPHESYLQPQQLGFHDRSVGPRYQRHYPSPAPDRTRANPYDDARHYVQQDQGLPMNYQAPNLPRVPEQHLPQQHLHDFYAGYEQHPPHPHVRKR